jgi:hypothetical protein
VNARNALCFGAASKSPLKVEGDNAFARGSLLSLVVKGWRLKMYPKGYKKRWKDGENYVWK